MMKNVQVKKPEAKEKIKVLKCKNRFLSIH